MEMMLVDTGEERFVLSSEKLEEYLKTTDASSLVIGRIVDVDEYGNASYVLE